MQPLRIVCAACSLVGSQNSGLQASCLAWWGSVAFEPGVISTDRCVQNQANKADGISVSQSADCGVPQCRTRSNLCANNDTKSGVLPRFFTWLVLPKIMHQKQRKKRGQNPAFYTLRQCQQVRKSVPTAPPAYFHVVSLLVISFCGTCVAQKLKNKKAP